MDRLDTEIIKLLSKNARMPLKQIAEAVSLTSPAVKSRIERLEKDGMIEGYALNLNTKAAGFSVTAFVSISVESAVKDRFMEYIRSCSNVLECYGITGDYFAILKVVFKSTMDLDNFLSDIQRFGETRTNIVLSAYKTSKNYGTLL